MRKVKIFDGKNHKTNILGALLLALSLLAQSLRLVLPLPLFVSMFIVGTLLNAILLMATSAAGLKPALIIAWAAPAVALLQGQLPGLPFVPLVAVGNTAYILLLDTFKNRNKCFVLVAASSGKTATLFFGAWALLLALNYPPLIGTSFSFVMSWPQFVTALAGGLLGQFLLARLGGKLSAGPY
ncbi:MAG: hypothetical protein LBO03_02940 [Acidaminococcales bacterium]|nr:hypothetical protein [Acidaminococcales bacterium]